MERHVFITHTQEDHAFAEQLISQVQAQGFATWIDNESQENVETIHQAIRDAFALIAIMSPAARASEYVTADWAFAYGCGIEVVPVIYITTPLHPRLGSLCPLNFTSLQPWNELINRLQAAASRSSDE